MPKIASATRSYTIALSFAGDGGNRAYVEKVAQALSKEFDPEDIFYDDWHEEEIIGVDSDLKLQHIYGEDADIVAPFFCKSYTPTH